MSDITTRPKIFPLASLLLALGVAATLDVLVSIEWTFPYCSSLADGPASPVYGMPLPYLEPSQASSMEDFVVSYVYILNLFLLGALLYPVANLVERTKLRGFIGGVGATLLLLGGLFRLASPGMQPVGSLSTYYGAYSDLRPIRLVPGFSREMNCTASKWWFPDGWQHN